METVIIDIQKSFTLYGFSKKHEQDRAYSKTIFELLDLVWKEVKSKELSHTGINHVVYDVDHIVFAGIELLSPPVGDSNLEKKNVVFQRYAYCKHIGAYGELDKTYKSMRAAINAQGVQYIAPILEIYGHWTEDESKLETEILYNLETNPNDIKE